MLSELPEGYLQSIIVHFNRSTLKKVFEGEKPSLWEELKSPVTQYVVQAAAGTLVNIYFEGINHLFGNQSALTEPILKIKLKELVLLLLRTQNSENIRKIVKSLFSDRQFTFQELVEEYIKTTESIEDLATVTHCSVSTFKRRFRKTFHTTPARYILKQKIQRAAALLKTSDESVSAIGMDCGFNSPEHLSRVFKQQFGQSPTEYRLSHLIK